MFQLTLKFDLKSYQKDVQKLLRKQLPFGTALALTRVAEEARDDVRNQLPEQYTLRSMWVPLSIRFEPATKRKLVARVGSLYPGMELQQEGGKHKPKPGQRYVAVPAGVRRQPRQRTTPSRWPKKLLKKPGHFIVKSRSKHGSLLLYKRNRKRYRLPITLLYVLRRASTVDPTFALDKTVLGTVKREWERQWHKAMHEAMKTAR